jgi:hypothetical protein
VRVRVECYEGYRGEETPRRFFLGRRNVEVCQVLDRWLAPDHRYFKVLDAEGSEYLLRHDADSGEWDVTSFSRGGGAAANAGSG